MFFVLLDRQSGFLAVRGTGKSCFWLLGSREKGRTGCMEKVNFEKKNVKILIFVIFGNPVFCQNLARAGWTMSFPIVKTCRKSPQKLRKVFLGEVGRAYKTIWGRGSPCWVARVPVWLLGWSEIQIRPRTDLASFSGFGDRGGSRCGPYNTKSVLKQDFLCGTCREHLEVTVL